jgi:hypothetical protein
MTVLECGIRYNNRVAESIRKPRPISKPQFIKPHQVTVTQKSAVRTKQPSYWLNSEETNSFGTAFQKAKTASDDTSNNTSASKTGAEEAPRSPSNRKDLTSIKSTSTGSSVSARANSQCALAGRRCVTIVSRTLAAAVRRFGSTFQSARPPSAALQSTC